MSLFSWITALLRGTDRRRSTRNAFLKLESLSRLAPSTFVAGTDYSAGGQPSSIKAADFNGDGAIDLVTANYAPHRISVMLNNGDGTFGTPVSYAAGDAPQGLDVGDFNGDGKPDVAVANHDDGIVSIFLNRGDGTFADQVQYSGGGALPMALIARDFNSDDHLDLVAANSGSGTVSIFLGNGDGTFQNAVAYDSNTNPISLTATDFNSDGLLDIAVGNGSKGTVTVLLGYGDGSFETPAHPLDVAVNGVSPAGLDSGDFNHDGKGDLAVANSESGTVFVLFGLGNGRFGDATVYNVGVNPRAVTVADWTGDGNLDFAVGNFYNGDVYLFVNQGDGSFQSTGAYVVGAQPDAVVGADFDNDGLLDLATSNWASNNMTVMSGRGDGTFVAAQHFAAGPSTTYTVAQGDINHDGNLDLVAANHGVNKVSILLGNGDGTFQAPVSYSVGSDSNHVLIADLTGDGWLDVATADIEGIGLLRNRGDGTFDPAVNIAIGARPRYLVPGDFNSDGNVDLGVGSMGNYKLVILLGNGDGTFQSPVYYGVGSGNEMVMGDFNLDGNVDAVATNLTDVFVFLGNGDGTFREVNRFASSEYTIAGLGVGDFNSDHIPDLAVEDASANRVKLWFGNGDGTFRLGPHVLYEMPGSAGSFRALLVADIDQDGKDDVFVSTPDIISVFKGNGDGTFQRTVYSAGPSPKYMTVGDFNGDGERDLAAAITGAPNIVLFLNGSIHERIELGDNAVIDEGDTFSRQGRFVQTDTQTWSALVNYGDGSGFQSLSLAADNSFLLERTYTDNGIYTLTVRLTNDAGRQVERSILVVVKNVAPVISLPDTLVIDEGSALTVTGSFVDPGADSWNATVDYGDGSGSQALVISADNRFALSHTFADNGTYSVVVTVRDDDGGLASRTLSVVVHNVAPSILLSHDASIYESSTFAINGSFIDPGADTWTATVDYGEGSGSEFLVLNADKTFQLDHFYADNGTYTIAVTVTDDDGGVGIGTLILTVNNVAPVVSVSGPATGVPGQERTFSFSAADPSTIDQAAGFTYTIDWNGDGTIDYTTHAIGTFEVEHTFSEVGTFSITVTATDKDGGIGTSTHSIIISHVTLQPDDCNPGQTALFIGGSNSDDSITVRQAPGHMTDLEVNFNGAITLVPGTGLSRIVVYGLAGNDDLRILGNVKTEAWLFGGEGNDRLKGGGGNNLLVGGDGDDLLAGGGGRNILIGGRGADRLVGGSNDDLIITGYTVFDEDEHALCAIMKEWTSEHNFLTRVLNLHDGSGSSDRRNGNYFLREGETVFQDNDPDTVVLSSGLDWYFLDPRLDAQATLLAALSDPDLRFLLGG